ncbi:MAG: glycoside hydrolase family 127 protein [Actinomycetota bacterium]|nr:glycoside hydrolase family 127 protein [Actinomycetota bacterium]
MVEEKFTKFKIGEIIPKGWLYTQLKRDAEGFVGHLDLLAEEAGKKVFINYRDEKKFIKEGMHKNPMYNWWDGEAEGNWMDGLVRLAFLINDEPLINKIKKYMNDILANRENDGYLGIYPVNYRFVKEFIDGELWTQSRILLAMIAFYEASREKAVLDLAIKAADLIIDNFSDQSGFKPIFEIDNLNALGHGLMIVEPMIQLYFITGNEKYIKFSKFCYDDYSAQWSIISGGDDCSIKNLMNPDGEFKGHGVHTCEHLRVPLLLYFCTGEEVYKIAYENAFDRVKNYLTVSGACKSDESVGIPLPTSGYEYCTITELMISYLTVVLLTGETQYADMAEKLLFNAGEASRNHDGKAIAYLSSDNLLYATTKKYKAPPRWCYSPTHRNAAVCCPPNSGRLLPYFINNMWVKKNEKEIIAMLYGPNCLKTKIGNSNIAIEEITKYPFENNIKIKMNIDKQVSFKLKLRIPGWAEDISLKINGETLDNKLKEDNYIVIERLWKNKDVVELEFETSIKMIEAVDHTIGIEWGSLVFALKIPEVATVVNEYNLKGFFDIDYNPQENSKDLWNYVIQIENLKNIGSNFFLKIEEIEENIFPWEYPPISIGSVFLDSNGDSIFAKLVPIGCTTLRKTTFNYVTGYKQKRRYYSV